MAGRPVDRACPVVAPGSRLRWNGATGRFSPTDVPGAVRIVDSWLVQDGRTRKLASHAHRFVSACAAAFSLPPTSTSEFFHAAAARIPDRGDWFPRVELAVVAGSPRLQLWVRRAPPRGDRVRLWISDGPDRRICPAVKGIDLEWLTELHGLAHSAGADESLILSPDGRVLEGSTTSVLWWRGSTLCVPPPTPHLLAGVTRQTLCDAVAADGGRVVLEDVTPADLDGLEVWAVNALHGIRPVTAWVGSQIRPGPADRAPDWNARLAGMATRATR